MPNAKTQALLNEIGQLLADDTDYPLDGTLLYAEVDSNYVAPSIFKDLGEHVLYRDPDLDLFGGVLLDLWKAENPANRWEAIEYVVRDDKFTATFTYPREIDPREDSLERRRRIVRQHFGDKRIVYPPMPDDPDIMEYKQ